MGRIIGVLTCDLLRSQLMSEEQRSLAQRHIQAGMAKLLAEHDCIPASGFEFRFGDEWQVVVSKPSLSFTIYSELFYHLKEYPFRCGIGLGSLTTSNGSNSHEWDGPAFHRARAALDSLKNPSAQELVEIRVDDGLLSDQEMFMLDAVTGLLTHVRKGRRQSQQDICAMSIPTTLSVESLARSLSIHRTSAYRRLQTSGAFEELRALRSIEGFLQNRVD